MLTFYKYLDGTIASKLFKKQSDEIISIKTDFTNVLETSEAVQSNGSSVKVYDSSDTDVSSAIIDGSVTYGTSDIQLKIKAGTDGEKYKITFKAATNQSRLYELDIYMIIEDI